MIWWYAPLRCEGSTPHPGCSCQRVGNSMKRKELDLVRHKKVRNNMILKKLGDLSVVICDYGFKDGKECGSISKSSVKAPDTPHQMHACQKKRLRKWAFHK
jgi:hypothetical protein